MDKKHVKFWLLQTLIWGGFGLFNFLIRTSILGFSMMEVWNGLALSLALLGGSGFIHRRLKSNGVVTLTSSVKKAVLSSFFAAGIGLLVLGTVLIPVLLATQVTVSQTVLLQIVAAFPNLWLFLFIWTSVYLLILRQKALKAAADKENELQTRLSQAKMDLLLSQLNPHFIFNAINNIRALILEDQQKARESLTQLSEVLRSLLVTEQTTLWPLCEELDLSEDFIALNQLQYEGRLKVEWQVDTQHHATPVPCMLLQLLLENAIKHGINTTPKGGKIVVSIKDNQGLQIQVSNPGHLPEQCAQIETRGIGIKNLTARLALIYGERATLSLSESNDRVTATVRIQGIACTEQ
ncbi:sensor histidine kinase [Thaumasiovibrio subtropicus]|uniref:sensor histidine kinase n=1 Tax=Thaumasiovibrio subtropicus TaxID=1891207 RepID=UPI000B359BC1|nr:histidine kinase [Thaumasiovibrio subtropicus]